MDTSLLFPPNRPNAKTKLVSPYAKVTTLRRLDGRRREIRLMRETRNELLAHVGPNPSATARALVEVCVALTLHVALFNARAVAAGGLSEKDAKQYLAFSNSLSRSLSRLGLKGSESVPMPQETFADIAREEAAKAAAD